MAKHLKYWSLVLLCTYGVTFAIHYLLRPIWFDGANEHTSLTMIEMLFSIAVLPVFLVLTNFRLAKKYGTRHFFIINAAIIYSCILLSVRLHFLNWADSIGSRDKPDTDTRMVVEFEKMVGLLVTTIGLIIAFIRLYRKRKWQPV
jgi:hypothetical protein